MHKRHLLRASAVTAMALATGLVALPAAAPQRTQRQVVAEVAGELEDVVGVLHLRRVGKRPRALALAAGLVIEVPVIGVVTVRVLETRVFQRVAVIDVPVDLAVELRRVRAVVVAHLLRAQKPEQLGDFQLAPLRRAGVVVGDRFPARYARADFAVGHAEADRHVGGDHLPLGLGRLEFALEPVQLLSAEEGFGAAQVVIVGPAIAAHVEHEHIQQRAIAELAINPSAAVCALPTHG